jgi:hypothetical protein
MLSCVVAAAAAACVLLIVKAMYVLACLCGQAECDSVIAGVPHSMGACTTEDG